MDGSAVILSTKTKSKGIKKAHRLMRKWKPYWFLAPALVLYVVFFMYPLLFSLSLSFQEWNLLSSKRSFVGFSNYIQLFQDNVYWKSVGNTLLYVLYTVPLSMLIGLLLAVAIESLKVGKTLLRLLCFIPVVSPIAVISIVWGLMYHPNEGMINRILLLLGVEGPNWLNDVHTVMIALALIGIWKHIGYNMVLYISGLKAIDRKLYEATAIDGAHRWQQFRHITIPLLSPMTFFILIMSLLSSFQVFATIEILTKGGPNNASNVLVYKIYQDAFRFFSIGTATASSMILLIAVGIITLLQLRYSRRFVHYQ